MRSSPFLLLALAACSGGEAEKPKPAPAPAPPPAAPAPAPAPADGVSKDTDISAMADADKQAFMMKLGKKVYDTGDGGIACTTCHGPEGKGTPGAFPPLVGQKDLMGDCKKHAGYVVHGLTGEMTVDGTKYNGVMTPQGALLNDLQIASVISYERHSWGNDFGWCSPDDVKAARATPPGAPAAP
jgi:mono/diheme cytochrome c family protein